MGKIEKLNQNTDKRHNRKQKTEQHESPLKESR